MASPPKPWERNAGVSTAASSAPTSLPAASTAATSDGPPALPARSTAVGTTAAYRPGMTGMNGMGTGAYGSTYGTGAYGSTGYGTGYGSTGYGMGSTYGSSYSSPYNRMGSSYGSYGSSYSSPYSRMGMGSSMYGNSYGGYGSSYGGYGMNRMGMGMNGMNGPMGPEEMSLMQRMEQGSMPTFQLIESVVGAFGGFAQMLESTFMATHSSFMAMVGVAEQFGHLRGYLGQVLSVFALLRWAKSLLYRLVGKKMPVATTELTPGNFQDFQAQPRISKRPLIIFLLAVFGLPYLMGRLIRALSSRNPSPELQQQLIPGPDGQLVPANTTAPAAINPQNLDFARALYDFNASSPQELTLHRGDIVAILSRTDAMGQESQWWMGRTRAGQTGQFPSNYVELINKRSNPAAPAAEGSVAASAGTSTTSGLAGAPGAPGAPNAAIAAQAEEVRAALAGSAFEEFKF